MTRVPLLADARLVVADAGPNDVVLRPRVGRDDIEDVGAAYLIVVGVRRILARGEEEVTQAEPADARKLYVQGAVVNVLNPKTALFFLAFLPQFVDPHRGSVTLQIAVLGMLFSLIALTSDAAYALLADALAGRVRRSGTGARLRRWVTGGIFVGLGISAAVARRAS